MIVPPHPADQMRALAWYGLATAAGYYFLAGIALRWRPRKRVCVVRYEPPKGISPAVAAYLWQRGVSEKPFVVALINMAAKGWLKIEQGPNDYLLSRSDGSVPLEDEEQVVADSLFRGDISSVCLSKLFRLDRIAGNVRSALESTIEPDLISGHFAWVIPALVVSLWSLVAALYPEMDGLRESQSGPIIILPAFIAAWTSLATIRTLPGTLQKLKSRLPGRTLRPLPLVKQDRTILVTIVATSISLGIIA
ncbi:MAG TPA: hypothetical protein VNW47_07185, partial [Terriglobales bacterium]|nr:hypothetical protein [Terriglobales bacterium]